jgi:fatty acid desaturase
MNKDDWLSTHKPTSGSNIIEQDLENAMTTIANQFSLAQSRAIVRDLFAPKPWIYWCDFLVTIAAGHTCFFLTRLIIEAHWEPQLVRLALAALTFCIQCVCFYRAVMFVHEIVHLPSKGFVAFRAVWNLLCGIPFLVPSFTYYPHLDHHRRTTFGTHADGEYLPLAIMSPWWIVVYLSQCLWVPLLAIFRFGVLTPLTWVCPPLRRVVYQQASSLVANPGYIRPSPTAAELRSMRLQEAGCFFFLLGVVLVARIAFHRWPYPALIQGYATGLVLVLMNSVRTLASHRWDCEGQENTFIQQMLDSVNLDDDSLLAVLINPVGLRYHATHHLFPSMPYHNVRAAHQRLMQQLPPGSPYRRTVEHSIWQVIAKLWRTAATQHSPERLAYQKAMRRGAASQRSPSISS